MKLLQFHVIRIAAAILFCLLCTASAGWAEEKLPTLRVGNVVYTNVAVMRVTATDVYFTFDKGMANAKLKNLDPAMQKHFNFDPEKAEAAAAKQHAAGTPFSLAAGSTNEVVVDGSNAQAVKEQAIARVKTIVNQPVRQLTATPAMNVSIYSPGWFHDGATEPNYATVDVRTSQETKYAEHTYVGSDLNPGLAFLGAEIEFNPNTKFFYTDRTLPKKRLTEAEMVEINRLYRIIAKCGETPPQGPILTVGLVTAHRNEIIFGTAGLLVVLVLLRSLTGRRSGAA